MKITVAKPDAKKRYEALVVFVFDGEKEPSGKYRQIDKSLGDIVNSVIAKENFNGKQKDVSIFYPSEGNPSKIVIVAGLGKRECLDAEAMRRSAGNMAGKVKSIKCQTLTLLLPEHKSVSLSDLSQASVEGVLLALYEFSKYKTKKGGESNKLSELTLLALDKASEQEFVKGAKKGAVYSKATIFARNLVNEPASVATPRRLADFAKQVAKESKVALKIFDEKKIRELGMGGLLGVSLGSSEPPRFVHLSYKAPGARKTVAIVGKAITFDSGGLCIKAADGMLNMKDDMSGAAAVLGIFNVINQIKPRVNVHGIFAATENMPGSGAYKTRDVLTAYNKKTMEIINTDAEGRVTLADSLSYASELKPDEIIDIATLTGSVVVGLGRDISGIFSEDDDLIERLIRAGKFTGEKMWRMPMENEYFDLIKSDIADIKNSGGREGGAITAALFLKEFVKENIKWAHIDIAGPCLFDSPKPYIPTGASGVMVRTMLRYLENEK